MAVRFPAVTKGWPDPMHSGISKPITCHDCAAETGATGKIVSRGMRNSSGTGVQALIESCTPLLAVTGCIEQHKLLQQCLMKSASTN